MNILLVDDNSHIRNSYCEYLADNGHEVLVAENGKRGWEIFSVSKGRIELLLTDLCMPVLDGLELIRRVREVHTELPIVVMTGYADACDIEAAAAYGAVVLDKPIDFPKLKDAFARLGVTLK